MDLLDPDTWKVPAALAEHWGKIAAGIVGVAAVFGPLLRWGFAPIKWLWANFRTRAKSQPSPPDERPLRFVPDGQLSSWGRVSRGNEPGTQVAGHWNVTNVSDRNVVILDARLANHAAEFTLVATESAVADRFGVRLFDSKNPIPAHRMSKVVATLHFFPSICDGPDPLVADVIFIDNYEREHVVRQARFRPINPLPSISDSDRKSVGNRPEPPERVLDLQVGESGPFFRTKGKLYDTRRTFNIKLSNVHATKTATNCKVHITKIEPQTEYEGPWSLTQGLTLAAGDYEFIPLATFGEARNPKTYNCADTFFTVHVEGTCPLLDIDKEYFFTLRATAVEIPLCENRVKLWVDNDGRFRIEPSG
jgi:hypothetical protein